MYARVLIALALGLLIFAGEQRALFAQSMLGVPGFQQQPPQQQQQREHPCQAEFTKLRDDIQNKGKSLQEAGKRKVPAKELCARIVSYSNAETNMLNFLTKRAQECGVPPEAADSLKKNRGKTAELRTKICSAANNPGPAPQSPSAGLSGAISPSAGVVPEAPTGGGIFDTLSGNILQQ
jgi:hypothetical protein